MRSFGHYWKQDSIPLVIWKEASQAITMSVRLLDKAARVALLELLISGLKSGKSKQLEFITFFASVILVSSDIAVNGNIPMVQSKVHYVFNVTGRPTMCCLMKDVSLV